MISIPEKSSSLSLENQLFANSKLKLEPKTEASEKIIASLLESSPSIKKKNFLNKSAHKCPAISPPFLKSDKNKCLKIGTKKKTLKSSDAGENDLEVEEIMINIMMDEKEIRILRFLEEENISMANPKEKQFEYFENVKKNAFLFYSAIDKSRLEQKRFSLDNSSLLNKRRGSFSLPRLIKRESSNSSDDNENQNENDSKTQNNSPVNSENKGLKNVSNQKKKSNFNKFLPKRLLPVSSPLLAENLTEKDVVNLKKKPSIEKMNNNNMEMEEMDDLFNSEEMSISENHSDEESNISSEKKSDS